LPPDIEPPPDKPKDPPDLASPGFWCTIASESGYQYGFIQTAVLTGEDHEPQPPEKGLPGTYVDVYSANYGAKAAWVPSPADPGKPEKPPGGGKPPQAQPKH
jgi:hypothetical protein